MADFIVTVKLPNDPNHDPKNKITGPCPITKAHCTDVTGAHHSAVIKNVLSAELVLADFQALGLHVTRIEQIETD